MNDRLKAAWLAEEQAIAIYQMECLILRWSAVTPQRKLTLQICQEVLSEESEHSESLAAFLKLSRIDLLRGRISRSGGYLLGLTLTLLPASLSWRVHSWAEEQAARIYQLAAENLTESDPRGLREALRQAMQQEWQHSARFKGLSERDRESAQH